MPCQLCKTRRGSVSSREEVNWFPVALVENKIDLVEERQVAEGAGEQAARAIGALFVRYVHTGILSKKPHEEMIHPHPTQDMCQKKERRGHSLQRGNQVFPRLARRRHCPSIRNHHRQEQKMHCFLIDPKLLWLVLTSTITSTSEKRQFFAVVEVHLLWLDGSSFLQARKKVLLHCFCSGVNVCHGLDGCSARSLLQVRNKDMVGVSYLRIRFECTEVPRRSAKA